jgi:hypothetical protein
MCDFLVQVVTEQQKNYSVWYGMHMKSLTSQEKSTWYARNETELLQINIRSLGWETTDGAILNAIAAGAE